MIPYIDIHNIKKHLEYIIDFIFNYLSNNDANRNDSATIFVDYYI